MTRILLAAVMMLWAQTAWAATVDFNASIFRETVSSTTTEIDGVTLNFWAYSYGSDRFIGNSGLRFGYDTMHAIAMTASETIVLTAFNGKTLTLDPSGAALTFSVLLANSPIIEGIEFLYGAWDWVEMEEGQIVIPRGSEFILDFDFDSSNYRGTTLLGAMSFAVYTPPPIPLPATWALLFSALLLGIAFRKSGVCV